MTYQGRIITPEIITEMRASDPERAAVELDAEWETMVLQNNARWIANPELRADLEAYWGGIQRAFPASFEDCGCNDH
jgi:hypothetical protein